VLALLILVPPAVFTTPRAVNSAAWLAGAGRPDTWTSGGAYDTQRGNTGCSPITYGTLASTGQVITWPGRVPNGVAVHFREPVWNVMSPRPETVPGAVVSVALGLFFEALAVLALAVFTFHVVRAVQRAGRDAVPISPRDSSWLSGMELPHAEPAFAGGDRARSAVDLRTAARRPFGGADRATLNVESPAA
jgi:hypothetical protein